MVLEDEERHLLSLEEAGIDMKRVVQCVMKCGDDQGLEGFTLEMKCREAERILYLLGGSELVSVEGKAVVEGS